MKFYLTTVIIATLISSASIAQANLSLPDTTTAIKLFKQAKEKFSRFEKEHGGYIQTKNV